MGIHFVNFFGLFLSPELYIYYRSIWYAWSISHYKYAVKIRARRNGSEMNLEAVSWAPGSYKGRSDDRLCHLMGNSEGHGEEEKGS